MKVSKYIIYAIIGIVGLFLGDKLDPISKLLLRGETISSVTRDTIVSKVYIDTCLGMKPDTTIIEPAKVKKGKPSGWKTDPQPVVQNIPTTDTAEFPVIPMGDLWVWNYSDDIVKLDASGIIIGAMKDFMYRITIDTPYIEKTVISVVDKPAQRVEVPAKKSTKIGVTTKSLYSVADNRFRWLNGVFVQLPSDVSIELTASGFKKDSYISAGISVPLFQIKKK